MKFNMTEKTKKGLIIGGACTALLVGGFGIGYMVSSLYLTGCPK